MVKITREEADMFREKAPAAHIAIVNRQHRSKEKTYYVEENRMTMALLRIARGLPEPEEEKKSRKWRGGHYGRK